MAQLTAKLFRGYFGGSWSCKITKNGEFQREIILNWPEQYGNFSALGSDEGMMVPPGSGGFDNTRQVSIAGWRSDVRRWVHLWYNEFGGSGEIQWTSYDVTDNVTRIYGFIHECKQETDDPTEHIIMCEKYDDDNFKYTIRSFRKGITEVVAKRIRTAKELKQLLKNQVKGIKTFAQYVINND